jgi:DNA-binding NarL/FixJ family response regulator
VARVRAIPPAKPMSIARSEQRRRTTLVIADGHPISLEGLDHVLTTAQFTVSARCTDGIEALRAIRKYRPDVFLVGFSLTRRDGLTVLRDLSRGATPVRSVFLADGHDEAHIVEALRLGVRGVFLKETSPHLLIACIRKVATGQRWLEGVSTARLVDKVLQREVAAREVGRELTNREVEIVRLVARGLRNKAIAAQLSIREGTIKIHLHHIFRKLQVDGRVGLILYARDKGFV